MHVAASGFALQSGAHLEFDHLCQNSYHRPIKNGCCAYTYALCASTYAFEMLFISGHISQACFVFQKVVGGKFAMATSRVFVVQELVQMLDDFAGDHMPLVSKDGEVNQWLGRCLPQLSGTVDRMLNGQGGNPLQQAPQNPVQQVAQNPQGQLG